jgi:hypothetical protein
MSKATFYCREWPGLLEAWANAYLDMKQTPGGEFAPFTVSVNTPSGLSLSAIHDHPMVRALDECLDHDGEQKVEGVAFTIFPERIWRLCGGDREELYREFMRSLRTFVKWEPRKNQGGMYFARVIGFGIDHRTGAKLGYKASKTLAEDGNQLEHVIRQCKKSVERGRKMARMQLQAAIFDPFRDLTTAAQPSFPCLQHLAFDPDPESGGLAVSAFYATQQLYVKAFGNWLGLCRLGEFVAGQAGLKLTRFSCFVGVQKMDKAPKSPALRANLLREAKEVAGRGIAPDLVVTGNG